MKQIFALLMLIPLVLFAQEGNYKKIEGFKYIGSIKASNDNEICPGQVSKDGKKYYLPEITPEGKGIINVYNLKLKQIASYLVEVPEGNRFSGKISLTEDEQVLIFTITTEDDWNKNELVIAEFDAKSQSYRKPRLMGEINEEDVADAYPFLSADGLRIYWIRDNKIMYSVRKERKFVFRYPEELKILNNDISPLSSWLSADELSLFLTSNSIIYKSTRKSLSEPFSKPQIFSDKFASVGFISAANVVPPYLFLFISTNDENEFIGLYKIK